MELPAFTVSQRRAAAAFVLLAVVVVLGMRHLHGSARRAVPAVPLVTVPRARRPVARRVVVDVVGAVRRPGLYRLREGTRISDAVALAGGMTPKADLAQVNLAAPLADGEQVVVPARGAAGVAAGASSSPGSPAAPVDLNTASAEQLDSLPGVGPTTAAKIIAFRQEHGAFHSLAELDAVPGIGPARLDELKGLVTPS